MAALKDDASVVLVDTDPQQSLVAWKNAREAGEPLVLPVATACCATGQGPPSGHVAAVLDAC